MDYRESKLLQECINAHTTLVEASDEITKGLSLTGKVLDELEKTLKQRKARGIR